MTQEQKFIETTIPVGEEVIQEVPVEEVTETEVPEVDNEITETASPAVEEEVGNQTGTS